MKKYICAIGTILLFVLFSCGKNEKTPYEKEITGVNLTDDLGQPVGSLGNPDVKSNDGNFGMTIFPTPCSSFMEVYVHSSDITSEAVTATLVPVIYKNAPKTWTYPTGTTINVNIENTDAVGTIATSQTQNLIPPDTSQSGIHSLVSSAIFDFDVTNLPQGFYRVYISTEDGKQLWDNGWVLR